MDNLSSSDLDSPSKTPLFIAIAAVIIGLAGLAIGWLGFTKAAELEQKMSNLIDASENATDFDARISEVEGELNSRVDQVGKTLSDFNREVQKLARDVSDDITSVKRRMRSVEIEAGTARKMVEELEKVGVKQVIAAPPPVVARDSGKGEAPEPVEEDEDEFYTIKSGDTLGKIAAAYKISLNDLLTANPGVDPRRLRIGQQIRIPGSNN